MIRLITSFLSEKEILKAPKSKVPVIFLGGSCADNAWRKDIKKEFGKDLLLLDPFNKNYDNIKDAPKELAAMVNSGYVIFYKGGEQTEQEKKFLDLIGRHDNLVKEFEDLGKLKEFLTKIKEVNLESIGSKIKKCAEEIIKMSTPFIQPSSLKDTSKPVDFHFEKLDKESIKKVVKDVFDGITVYLPQINGGSVSYIPFNIDDVKVMDPAKQEELGFLKMYLRDGVIDRQYSNSRHNILFYYDEGTHKYMPIEEPGLIGGVPSMESVNSKTAKANVVYEYSCTKVNIPEELSKEVMKWGKDNVPDKDLYVEDDESKGREDDIHITVLYGIVDDNPTETAAVIGRTKPFEVRLGLINAFKDSDKYDVLKIEVESGDIERLHYSLKEEIKNESTFPTYHPHVTIAYVKKGSMDKFIGDDTFKGKTFKVSNIVFSDGKNMDKEKELPLGI